MGCIFCQILNGKAPASFVYEDEAVVAFLSLHQVRDGECLVIPRQHIDHLIDVPEDLATRLFQVGHRLSRALQAEFKPQRMGMIVHGFGVPHAHLILLPQHSVHDITSARFLVIENGKPRFTEGAIPEG